MERKYKKDSIGVLVVSSEYCKNSAEPLIRPRTRPVSQFQNARTMRDERGVEFLSYISSRPQVWSSTVV